MRIADPLILGAGPAGCAAAISLASAGATPILLDRDEQVGDPLCGGFLSWRTVAQLNALGIDIAALGAHRVTRLRLFDGERFASASLPHAAYGLSRHALDSAMREMAVAAGAQLSIDTIRQLHGTTALGERQEWVSNAVFLASGKYDVRGAARPRDSKDAALGLRLRLPASPERSELLAGAIELHLFKGGYAGIVLQEGGSANVCLALRKSALAGADGSPSSLFAWLADRSAAFAGRLGDDWQEARIDTIGSVPYGFVAEMTEPGLYRLGDQAAVIPSLAGEGMAIAIASGVQAADNHLSGIDALQYQRAFALRVRRPVRIASLAWRIAERQLGARAAIVIGRIAPTLLAALADGTRIAVSPSLAPK